MTRRAGSRRWALARLRAMTPAEVAWRMGRGLQGVAERVHVKPVAPSRLPRRMVHPQVGVLFPRCAAERARVTALYPDAWRTALVTDADRILSGAIPLYGRWHEGEWPPEWRRDPVSGLDAGTPFYTTLMHPSAETVGDYRAIWEVNRHAALVTLARAAYVTGDARYAHACIAGAQTFLEQNPTGRGINWVSALEVGLRAIAWTAAWCFLEAGDHATNDQRATWARAIARQTGYVRAHLSAHSSANNHLVGEAAALVVVGCVLRDLPSASRWRRRGAAILAREADRQIHADGVGAEQSVHYLAFTMELLTLATACADRAGEPLPSHVLGRLARAADFLAAVRDEGGHRPALGDADDAIALPLGVGPHDMVDVLVPLVLALRDGAACESTEPGWWLLPPAAQGTREDTAPQPLRRFGDGGVCVLRAGRTMAVLDTGPLGYLSLAAHGHADPLALWVSMHGAPLIIDPGTGSYAPARTRERAYFRSARAHATLVVNDTEPAEAQGPFLWGARYRSASRFLAGDASWSVVEGEHDGFRRLRCRVRRRVHVDGSGYVLVVDTVDTERPRTLTQSWPFDPPFVLGDVSSSGARVLRAPDGRLASIAAAAVVRGADGAEVSTELAWSTVRGSTDPIDGWASPAYDVVEPCTVVRAHVDVPAGVATIVTLLSSGETRARLRTVRGAGSRSVSVTVDCAGVEHEWIVLSGGTPAPVHTPNGILELSGETASARAVRSARDLQLSARGSGDFTVGGRVVRKGDEWAWRLASAAGEGSRPLATPAAS